MVTYIDSCLKPLFEDLPDHVAVKDWIFYQDKAPCHRGKKTQEFLEENLPGFLPQARTPPNSPDLNVLDYCVWSLLKGALSKHKIVRNFDQLEKLLQKEWDLLDQTAIDASVLKWRSRIVSVLSADGGHIE